MVNWMKQDEIATPSVVSTMTDDDTLAESIINEVSESKSSSEYKTILPASKSSREYVSGNFYSALDRRIAPKSSSVKLNDAGPECNRSQEKTPQKMFSEKTHMSTGSNMPSMMGGELLVHRSNLNMKTDTVMGRRGFNSTIFSDCIEEWSTRYESAKQSSRRNVAIDCMQEMSRRGCRFLVSTLSSTIDDSSTTTSKSDLSSLYITETDFEKISEKTVRSFRRHIAQKGERSRRSTRDHDAIYEGDGPERTEKEFWDKATEDPKQFLSTPASSKWEDRLSMATARAGAGAYPARETNPKPVSLGRTHSLYCPGDDEDIDNPKGEGWNPSHFFDDQQQQYFSSLNQTMKDRAQRTSDDTLDPKVVPSQASFHSVSPDTVDFHYLAGATGINGMSLHGGHNRDNQTKQHSDRSRMEQYHDFKYKKSLDDYVQANMAGAHWNESRNVNDHSNRRLSLSDELLRSTLTNRNGNHKYSEPKQDSMREQFHLKQEYGSDAFEPERHEISPFDRKFHLSHEELRYREAEMEFEKKRRLSLSASMPNLQSHERAEQTQKSPPSYITTGNMESQAEITPLFGTDEGKRGQHVSREERMNTYRQWLREGCTDRGEVPATRHKMSIEELSARFDEVEKRADDLGRHNRALLERLSMIVTDLARTKDDSDINYEKKKLKGTKRKAGSVGCVKGRKGPKRAAITKETIQRLEARQNLEGLSSPAQIEANDGDDISPSDIHVENIDDFKTSGDILNQDRNYVDILHDEKNEDIIQSKEKALEESLNAAPLSSTDENQEKIDSLGQPDCEMRDTNEADVDVTSSLFAV